MATVCCIQPEGADLNRCQGKKRNMNTASGNPAWERCTETAKWVATEIEPSPTGVTASISLCEACKQLVEEQLPPNSLTFQLISPRAASRQRETGCANL